VDDRQQDQDDASGPDQFRSALEKLAVAIDAFRPQENLQIADEMRDDEPKKRTPAQGHDVLLAQ